MRVEFFVYMFGAIVAALGLGIFTDMISTVHGVDLVLRFMGGLLCGHIAGNLYFNKYGYE